MADSADFTLDGDVNPLERALARARSIFTDFASWARDKMSQVITAIFDQMPLFLTDLTTGLREGFKGVRELEDELAQTESTIIATGNAAGFTADQIREMADALQDAIGVNDAATVSAANLLLRFTNVKGEVFEETIRLAHDYAAVMGGDAASATELLGRVLQSPIQGLKTLREQGIFFNIEQLRMIDHMRTVGDVAGVQRIILEQLGDIFGGAAARRAETFGGQIDRINNLLGDMWRQIASALTPAIKAVLPAIEASTETAIRGATIFGEWVTAIINWAQESAPVIQEWASTIIDVLKDVTTWIVDRLVEAFTFAQTAAEQWQVIVTTAVEGVKLAFEELKVFVMDLWANLVNWVLDQWSSTWSQVATQGVDLMQGLFEFVTKGLENTLKTFDPLLKLIGGEGVDLSRMLGIDELAMTTKGAITASAVGAGLAQVEGPDTTQRDEMRKRFADMMDNMTGSFDEAFDTNLSENRALKDKFVGQLEWMLGLRDVRPGQEGQAAGGPGGAPFVFEADQSRGGAFEDLLSLQKRIQGAAFKTPEVAAMDQQTQFLKQAHMQTMAATQQVATAVSEGSTEVATAVKEQDTTSRFT